MKTYEITYLTVHEENHNAGTIAEALQKNEAKIVSVHPWGPRRKLVFPIQKQDQAFYTTVVFEAEPAAVKPIEDTLRLNTEVLRSIIVLFEPGYFHRAPEESRSSDSRPAKTEEKAVEVTETPTEETPAEKVAIETPTEEPTTEVEVAAKPKRASKTKEPKEDIDKKIDDLLNEDITA